MATTIRPELSEKNPYWIEKHRYYELKHFCLQYPIWQKQYSLDTIFNICELSGFHVEERIVIKDNKTGRIWR